jgi:hypothetical protein
LKRAGLMTELWRIRTDAPTKSFRIEKQAQAEKWTAAAAFQVAAGLCKPAPRKEAAEPTEETAAPAVEMLVVPTPGRKAPPTLKKK